MQVLCRQFRQYRSGVSITDIAMDGTHTERAPDNNSELTSSILKTIAMLPANAAFSVCHISESIANLYIRKTEDG